MNTFDNHMVQEFDPRPSSPDIDPMDAASEQMERETPAFTTVAATDSLIRALEKATGLLDTSTGIELAALRVQLMCARRNQRSAA